MSIHQHISGIIESIQQHNGITLTSYLYNSFHNSKQLWTNHSNNNIIHNIHQLKLQLEQQCGAVSAPLNNVLVYHLIASHIHGTQYNIQLIQQYCYEAAEYLFTYIEQEKDIIWCLPAINVLCIQLRYYSQLHSTSSLMATQELLRSYLQRMIVDRSDIKSSKKLGCIMIINQLFKIYFFINNLRLCTNLINLVKNLPSLDYYPISHQVTYQFYLGRLCVFEENYNKAELCLTFAFNNCHIDYTHNKQQILHFLIPIKLLHGQYPTPQLLEQYNLQTQFQKLIHSLINGDISIFISELNNNRQLYIKMGIYLLVEKLRYLLYRNIIRRIYIIHSKQLLTDITSEYSTPPHQLPLQLLLCGVHISSPDTTMTFNELECIIANLIHYGYIRGYIAHKRFVVLSKTMPFPLISTIDTPT